jgi:hypothetical protein
VRHPIIALLGAAVLAASACGGAAAPSPSPSPSPSRTAAPTPTPVSQVIFTADLKASNTVPPITDDEKNINGTATVTFDLTRDSSGKVTSATVKMEFNLKDVPPTSKIILAHIHEGGPTVNGAVKIDSTLTAATALTPVNKEVSFTKTGISVTDAVLIQAILDNPAGYYFNTHSMLHPGGVARGQLTKKA